MDNNPRKVLGALVLTAVWLAAAAGVAGPAAPPSRTSLPQPVAQNTGKAPAKTKHVIVMWMHGGPSQCETFDPKPGHANGGPVKAIDTSVKGVQFSEYLPQLAKQAHHLAVIRTLKHPEGDHSRSAYLMHTGYQLDGFAAHPSLGCVLGKELGDDKADVPRFVVIDPPQFIPADIYGTGYLDGRYGPLFVGAPDRGIDADKGLDPRVPGAEAFPAFSNQSAKAMRKAVLKAFDLGEEKKALREAYGLNAFGQSCLLARRLVQLGVPVVEVSLGGWDTHGDNFQLTQKRCDVLDPAFAALVADLQERQLLDSTLIVWMGEFGRTPKINANKGRDHWPFCFSVVLAGANIKGGQVVGRTQPDGMGVAERPVSVPEFLATVCQAVGVDPGRNHKANSNQVIPLVPRGTKAIAELLK
jgi:hypothetical protein